jgi:hypothetical protein
MSLVHCTFRGNQHDYNFEDIFPVERYAAIGIPEGMDVTPSTISEEMVKTALAQKLDVGVGEFSDSHVEINSNGNITVRPNAVFG